MALGDRRDGKYLKKIDSMHVLMPIIYPERCNNEAFITETIDMAPAEKYLEKLNDENPDYRYNFFQIVVTAMLKALILRPKMNYFIANQNMYARNFVSAAFTVKQIFTDNGQETLARLVADPQDTIHTIHEKIYRQVSVCKDVTKLDPSSAAMDVLQKIPKPLLKLLGLIMRYLDSLGLAPRALIETDPYQNSLVISNVGSIGLNAGFHHLTNWGTTSVFLLMGQYYDRPYFDKEGGVTIKKVCDLNFTVDERIADGYYYAKSVRLIKKLLENPELLEEPLSDPVDY